MITVHITDDHKMLAEGLQRSIEESKIAKVTNIACNLAECRTALAKELPDILLLDVSLPDGNGVDFCAEIKHHYPSLKILILTTYNVYSIASRAMENGASGYILKNELSEEVVDGIKAVMNNQIFLSCETDAMLHKRNSRHLWLTVREQQLLGLLVEGSTNKEMARAMCLSIETIKSYRKKLIFKLDVKNSITLVKMAVEQRLV